MKFYLSTIADMWCSDGEEHSISYEDRTLPVAERFGLGLELAEFCVAENLDGNYPAADREVRRKLARVPDVILHAPFNELCPCAIDPMIAEVAAVRYGRALELSEQYGAGRIVIHGGYVPTVYYRSFFVSQSVRFWKNFLAEHPGDYLICLENVMEDEPEMLRGIVDGVDDTRLRICLDLGHANLTKTPLSHWIEVCAPKLAHLHIHNNNGAVPGAEGAAADLHGPLDKGNIDMEAMLKEIFRLCPEVTATVECRELTACAEWLREKGFI